MIDAAAILAFLVAVVLYAIGLRAYAQVWLLYAVAVLLLLGRAIEHVIEDGPTIQHVIGVVLSSLIVIAWLFMLRHRPPSEQI